MSNINVYKLGGMVFGIYAPMNSYVQTCKDYVLEYTDKTHIDFNIEITPEDIETEKSLYAYDCTDQMALSTCIYRRICNHAIEKGGFFLHSAVVEYENKAYAFIAPSGTGKSTHIRLWKKLLGDRVDIVNGDKPLIMPNKKGGFDACGTPWCGKEGWQRNVAVPLEAVCVLKRGETNTIRKISAPSLLSYLMRQTIIPKNKEKVTLLLENIDRFLSCGINCYILECNTHPDAARVSFEMMVNNSVD